MGNCLVSIIVPFYKGEKYINNAIESILNQTYKNIELLLIENGIKDNSEKIIKNYMDERINYFYLKEGNVSNARNYGISKAKGEFIYFMDGDDTISNNLIEKCIKLIKEKNVDLILFNFNKVSDNYKEKIELPWKNETLDKNRIKNELIPPMVSVEKGEKSIMGTVWRIFTYRHNIDDIRFDNNIKIAEDMLFCIQLYSRINSIYVLDEALYNYTLSSSSTLNQSKLDIIYLSITYHEVLKNILVNENLYDDDMQKRFYKNQGRMYTTAISSSSRNSDKKLAKDSIKNIIKIYKKDKYNYFKLNFPMIIKITFILMKLNMVTILFYVYKCKEKIRMRKYNS